jgi:NhaP-type Na+/H+ and K+/H+ antiporter
MIPILFILLSARLTMSDLEIISITSLMFLGIIILIARPVSVFAATLKSDFNLIDKIFISLLAPRGIVAAAVSSVFAIKLTNIKIDQIEYLVPITFLVIIGTVLFYSIISPIAAKLLKISQTNPQGIIIAGGQDWVVDIAKVINQNGIEVLLFDTNRANVKNAKLNGIKAVNESIISEHIADEINLDGMGKFVALTSNDEVNSLGVLNFSEIFDVENLFQLIPKNETERNNFSPQHLRGRYLFSSEMNYSIINQKFLRGAVVKSTKITEEFTFDNFIEKNRDSVIPLFLIDNNQRLIPFTVEDELLPVKGNIIIAIYNGN